MFTGGSSLFRPGQPPEGDRYLKEAESLGQPPAALASTPPVVNTAEEAVAIRRLLERSQNKAASSPRILLVTSAFHMQRAQCLFERQGLVVEPFPVDFQVRGVWVEPQWRDPTHWFPSAGALDASSPCPVRAAGPLGLSNLKTLPS